MTKEILEEVDRVPLVNQDEVDGAEYVEFINTFIHNTENDNYVFISQDKGKINGFAMTGNGPKREIIRNSF